MTELERLSVSRVANLLEVSNSTVYSMIHSGRLPATKGSHGAFQIELKDVIALIRSSRGPKEVPSEWLKIELEELKRKRESEAASGGIVASSLTRRQFLKGSLSLVLGFITGVVTEMVGSGGATFVYGNFADEVQRNREVQQALQNQAEMVENLFGRLYDASWSANMVHFINTYGLENLWSSNTARASVALGSILGLGEIDWLQNATLTEEFPGPVQIDGDIIAMGSPVSDPVARLNMEYEGESRYTQRRNSDPLIDLPITYEIGFSLRTGEGAPVKRYVAGKQHDKPNTTLRIEGEFLPPPKLDRNGWLQSDYLLITRMPNILNRKAFFSSSEVLIIGGTHGVGTEAIDLLVNDVNLLKDVVHQRGDAHYFQALIPILDVEHGTVNGLAHAFPRSLGKPLVRKVSVDVERVMTHWANQVR